MSYLPAVPAVVLKHIEGGVGEEGSASHRLVAWILLWVPQLLHHTLTVPQQLIQPQLPATKHTHNIDTEYLEDGVVVKRKKTNLRQLSVASGCLDDLTSISGLVNYLNIL